MGGRQTRRAWQRRVPATRTPRPEQAPPVLQPPIVQVQALPLGPGQLLQFSAKPNHCTKPRQAGGRCGLRQPLPELCSPLDCIGGVGERPCCDCTARPSSLFPQSKVPLLHCSFPNHPFHKRSPPCELPRRPSCSAWPCWLAPRGPSSQAVAPSQVAPPARRVMHGPLGCWHLLNASPRGCRRRTDHPTPGQPDCHAARLLCHHNLRAHQPAGGWGCSKRGSAPRTGGGRVAL